MVRVKVKTIRDWRKDFSSFGYRGAVQGLNELTVNYDDLVAFIENLLSDQKQEFIKLVEGIQINDGKSRELLDTMKILILKAIENL